MKHVKFYIALLLFCFQSGAFSVPLAEDGKPKEYEVEVYNYVGHIDTRTSASNETIARLTISGDLNIYSYPDIKYIQLDNVRTSIYNGPKDDYKNVEQKPVPPNAEIIQQMFGSKLENDLSTSLYFKENEPLWSINMKKGIYSFIDVEYEILEEEDGKILPLALSEADVKEKTIYGECIYHVKQDGPILTKIMNGWNCTNKPFIHETNYHRAPGSKDLYEVLDYQYNKVMVLKKRGGNYNPSTLVQKTRMEYKSSPSAQYSQIIEQEQSYEFSHKLVTVETVDPSEFTVKTDLIYKSSGIRYAERFVEGRNSSELSKNFLAHFNEFSKRFNYTTPEHYNIRTDHIYDMYQILLFLDVEGFEQFENDAVERREYNDLGYFYFSLIPYVGTKASIEYLTNFMKTYKINNNIGFAHKIFATIPNYIKNPTDEILEYMEPLMNHESAKYVSLKNSALLSFAASVGHACVKGGISKKYKTKYIEIFHNEFLELEDYEERMAKLLGLVNMAPCLDSAFINSITTNTTESTHLRALALVGFKENLKNYELVYEVYWPIVQKQSEPFEVRVRALDLLLSSKLTEDQFNSIVHKYSKSLNDPEDKQLANYVLSTLHSIKKTTGYSDYLGEFALEALKDNKIPTHPKEMVSGYYRLSYTDAAVNTGSLFDVRLIIDPLTNTLDTIEVTFNNFGNSVDFGTYTLYFKFDGFFDWAVCSTILKKTSQASSVPELLKLLKEHNFELQTPIDDIHVELVFFIDNQVVFTRYFSNFKPEEIKNYGSEFEDIAHVYRYVSFPVLEYAEIPSDFGTPIEFHNYMEDITKHEIGDPNGLLYRSSWSFQTWFDIYCPLVDTSISSFKYYVDEKNLLLDFTGITIHPPTMKWIIEEDSYAQYWDNMMGTMVDEEKVKIYCPKCEAYSEIEADVYHSWTNSYEPLGFNALIESKSYDGRTSYGKVYSEIFENGLHKYNADAFPYAVPILYVVDVLNYKFWLRSELSRGSIRVTPLNGEYNGTETNLKLYFQVPNKLNFGGLLIYALYLESDVKSVETNQSLNSVNTTTLVYWDTDYKDPENETMRHKILKFLEFDFKYKSINPENQLKICGYGDLVYPNRRNEILSLLPFESITGETVFNFTKNVDDDENCIPEYTYTLSEVYSSNNLETELEKEDFKKSYEKCAADSEGLKFTAPTEECKKVSSRITEYDNYKVFAKLQYHNETHNETILEMKVPSFEYSRLDENTVNVTYIRIDDFTKPDVLTVKNFKMYYPKTVVDPAAYAYSKDDTVFLLEPRSTCTITPSTIEQFSGKYIPNQKNEWLAFAECFNTSTTGLNGRTIDEKHVGFTFYSSHNIVEATVNEGKAHITLNGKHITEFYNAEDLSIKIYYLSEDVVYIIDDRVGIYYNTEYVAVRASAIYPKLLCGVCTQ